MPKLLTGAEREIGKAIRSEATAKGRRLYPEEIERIIDTHDVEFVGSGQGCAVVTRERNPEEVIAFRFEDMEPKRAKEAFYLQAVLSTLFPHNFPHLHAGSGRSEEEKVATATIRRRIRGHQAWEDYGEEFDSKAKYPFKKVLDTCRDLELPVAFDSFMENFAQGEDEGVYYLDSTRSIPWREWNLPAIRKFMDEAKDEESNSTYTRRDKRIVEKSIRRLVELSLAEMVE